MSHVEWEGERGTRVETRDGRTEYRAKVEFGLTEALCLPSPPSLPLSPYPTAMEWFPDGVVDAIAVCRRDKSLFIVYVYGKLDCCHFLKEF